MDVTTAKRIVSETVEGRKRWGKMFLGEWNVEQVLDALVLLDEEMGLAQALNEGMVDKDELTKTKRQLTASKAREAKLKKKIEKLTAASGGE